MTGATQQDVQINFAGGVGKVVIDGSRFDVTADSKVVAYTDREVCSQPPASPKNEGQIASIGEDFSVAVYGAKITKTEAGFTIQATSIALRLPANENQTSLAPTSLKERALEVGERLRDGTVVVYVDFDNKYALFVPAKIFRGRAMFFQQDDVVRSANRDSLHGHNDWRRITDDEGRTLADNWEKVAPAELQGLNAPWFWLASPNGAYGGRTRGGDGSRSFCDSQTDFYEVPVVRSGPARTLDI